MFRPSLGVHTTLFILGILPALLSGFLGGMALGFGLGSVIAGGAAQLLGGVGAVFVVAIPIGTMGGAALGAMWTAQVLGFVMRLIPARCPKPECGGTALLISAGEYRCVTCGDSKQIDGVAGTGGMDPKWLHRFQQRRIDRALKALSDRNVEGRVAVVEPSVEGALSPADAARHNKQST